MNDQSGYDAGGPEGPETYSISEGAETVAAPEGFLGRLSNSFGAILFGLVAVPLACWGLFVNEGRAVKTARALSEGQGLVVSISPDRVDPAMMGKLVHLSGDVRSAAGVADPLFGVQAKGIKLVRKVEMYQFVETESGSGQDRKVTYTREWRDHYIDWRRFKVPQGHNHGDAMSVQPATFMATDARIGQVPLGGSVGRLSGQVPLAVSDAGLAKARTTTPRQVRLIEHGYYIGLDPTRPNIADLRITYSYVPEGPATIVGRQASAGLEPYRASNGREILLASSGLKSPAEMFGKAQDDNATMTWILRAVGLFGMFIAFSSLFAPVRLLASYVPILGSLVSGAVSLVAASATAILGPLVIAIAWIAYRPLVGIGVLVIGLALAFAFRQMRLKKQAAMQPRMA